MTKLDSEIVALRERIKQIDLDIIRKLAERQELCKQLGRLKSKAGLELMDPLQEAQQFACYQLMAIKYKLPYDYLYALFKYIISQSKLAQREEFFA